MLHHNRAGETEWAQPRELIGQITEAFAEEDTRLDRVGRVGTDTSGARARDTPRQSRGDQRLMQVVAVDLSLDCEIRRIESRAIRTSPIAVSPTTIKSDAEGWGEKTEKRPSEPVIDDVAAFARMFEA